MQDEPCQEAIKQKQKPPYPFAVGKYSAFRAMSPYIYMLIMLPMWINFLLRTYAWMSILDNNGLLNRLFQDIGLIALYNSDKTIKLKVTGIVRLKEDAR